MNSGAVRSTIDNFSAGKYRELRLALPPLVEQRRIADFLDHQVTLLDHAIQLRQQQIDLLKERHEAFREEALLGAKAPMASVASLLATGISDGPHETPAWTDEGVPFLSVDSVVDDELRFDGKRFISQADHERYAVKAVPQFGDVLVTKAASIGKVAEVRVNFDFNVWSPLAILRPDLGRTSTSYLAHALRLRCVQTDLRLTSNTNTQANLSMSALGRARVPCPSLSTQGDLVSRVNESVASQVRLKGLLGQSMALLRERKQSLITAAVSGEFDVRVASGRGVLA